MKNTSTTAICGATSTHDSHQLLTRTCLSPAFLIAYAFRRRTRRFTTRRPSWREQPREAKLVAIGYGVALIVATCDAAFDDDLRVFREFSRLEIPRTAKSVSL